MAYDAAEETRKANEAWRQRNDPSYKPAGGVPSITENVSPSKVPQKPTQKSGGFDPQKTTMQDLYGGLSQGPDSLSTARPPQQQDSHLSKPPVDIGETNQWTAGNPYLSGFATNESIPIEERRDYMQKWAQNYGSRFNVMESYFDPRANGGKGAQIAVKKMAAPGMNQAAADYTSGKRNREGELRNDPSRQGGRSFLDDVLQGGQLEQGGTQDMDQAIGQVYNLSEEERKLGRPFNQQEVDAQRAEMLRRMPVQGGRNTGITGGYSPEELERRRLIAESETEPSQPQAENTDAQKAHELQQRMQRGQQPPTPPPTTDLYGGANLRPEYERPEQLAQLNSLFSGKQ